MHEAALTIGEVAQRVGINTSAIRFYEAKGVLPEAAREHGQRRYSPRTVQQLRVIAVAKQAGFSLDEARLLLMSGDEQASGQLRDLAARKLPEVDALIERAHAMRTWLTTATGCNCQNLDACALFEDGSVRENPPATELRIVRRNL